MNYLIIRHIIKEYFEKQDNIILRKIQRYDKDFFVFEFYVKGTGNLYLYVILGKCIGVFNTKPENAPEPDSFVMRLRKDFKNKNVVVKQFLDERIIEIIDNDENKIIIELFKPGNIIVTDKNNIIKYALFYKDFGSRKIMKNEVYKIINPFSFPKDYNKFYNMLKNSNKKDIVRFLAIDMRLGGQIAEAVINHLNIDKKLKPQEIQEEQVTTLYEVLQNTYNDKRYLEDILGLRINEILTKECKSENRRLRALEEKRRNIEAIISEQTRILNEYEAKAKIYKKIGEFIKNYYWILQKDIESIKKFFLELGINAKIHKKGKNIEIELEEKDLDKLI